MRFHPIVQGFELFCLLFAADAAADRHGDARGRTGQPASVTMQQFFHARVGLRREQDLAGFKELTEVLDLPKLGIGRYPLRR